MGDDGQWGYAQSVAFDLDALIAQTIAPVPAEVYATKVADIAAAMSTLRAQVSELSSRSATAEIELEEFKNRVAAVASRYAKAHGWCSVVDEALSDLGLERISSRYTAALNIRVEFTATSNDPGTGYPHRVLGAVVADLRGRHHPGNPAELLDGFRELRLERQRHHL